MQEESHAVSQGNGAGSTSSQPEILLAQDLHKSYGPRPALRGLSFSLRAFNAAPWIVKTKGFLLSQETILAG